MLSCLACSVQIAAIWWAKWSPGKNSVMQKICTKSQDWKFATWKAWRLSKMNTEYHRFSSATKPDRNCRICAILRHFWTWRFIKHDNGTSLMVIYLLNSRYGLTDWVEFIIIYDTSAWYWLYQTPILWTWERMSAAPPPDAQNRRWDIKFTD